MQIDQALAANNPTKWDEIWRAEGEASWRPKALAEVYDRILALTPPQCPKAIDLGGGLGFLARQLHEVGVPCEVWDHSDGALEGARQHGIPTQLVDLEGTTPLVFEAGTTIIATEVLEHLSPEARHRILKAAYDTGAVCFFSVPHDRLGPEEEPQHTRKFTALEFLTELRQFWGELCRVEVLGPIQEKTRAPAFLLGVCGARPKGYRLSVTMPVRDEEMDLGLTLATFRGVADEMVIGIDPRSKDGTWDVAAKYAEKVFFIEHPRGVGDEMVASENGVHFGHIRNECMDRCTGDWIFMTEGHEILDQGQDALLNLDQLPEEAQVVCVLRRGKTKAGTYEQWGFPWLCRNRSDFRYKRSTHNVLDFPDGTYTLHLRQVRTLHDRVHERDVARQAQRKGQNRLELFKDWSLNCNANSLYYLGTEWREFDEEKAVHYLELFLAKSNGNGPARYQTRLILAKMFMIRATTAKDRNDEDTARENRKKARAVLMGALDDDWSRTDHWIWLGDIAYEEDSFEEAIQFYTYGATRIGNPPFTMWWIDLSYYSYIPAQRLAMVFGALHQDEEALVWAQKVVDLMTSEDAPEELIEEARENVRRLSQTESTPGGIES